MVVWVKGGSPTLGEGSGLIAVVGRWLGWVSDRVIVPLRPGNSRGGKGPDFWCAFKEGGRPETSRKHQLFADLVVATKLRWRIERDYQDLKQEVGLGHYEGRGWRGFHHHATLCIAAYGFLISERGAFPPSGWLAARKLEQAVVSPRGRPGPATAPSGAARDELDRDHATEAHRRPGQDTQPVSMLPRAAP